MSQGFRLVDNREQVRIMQLEFCEGHDVSQLPMLLMIKHTARRLCADLGSSYKLVTMDDIVESVIHRDLEPGFTTF